MKNHTLQIIPIIIAVIATASYLIGLPSVFSKQPINTVTMDSKSAQAIIDFWFVPSHAQKWYGADAAFDKAIKSEFGALHTQLSSPNKFKFVPSAGPKVALAAIILLDQFSRNLHRGSPKSYENDVTARELAEKCIARDWDRELKQNEKLFMYMPFMHAEEISAQTMGLVLFRDLAEKAMNDMKGAKDDMKREADAMKETAVQSWKFAKIHYRTIEKFGRFPARNEALGRQSTEEEKKLVAEGKGGFVYGDEE